MKNEQGATPAAREWLNNRIGKEWEGAVNGQLVKGIHLDPAGFPDTFEIRLSIKEQVSMLEDYTADFRADNEYYREELMLAQRQILENPDLQAEVVKVTAERDNLDRQLINQQQECHTIRRHYLHEKACKETAEAKVVELERELSNVDWLIGRSKIDARGTAGMVGEVVAERDRLRAQVESLTTSWQQAEDNLGSIAIERDKLSKELAAAQAALQQVHAHFEGIADAMADQWGLLQPDPESK